MVLALLFLCIQSLYLSDLCLRNFRWVAYKHQALFLAMLTGCFIVLLQFAFLQHTSKCLKSRNHLSTKSDELVEQRSKKIVGEDVLNDESIEESVSPIKKTHSNSIKQVDNTVFKFPTTQNPLDQIDHSQSHPLENQCRFPLLQPEEPDLSRYVRHFRAVRCPASNSIPLVTQLKNGQILFGKPHRSKLEKEVDCFARQITGTLMPRVRKVVELGEWMQLPPNTRVSLQWHQFVVKCYYSESNKLLFHDVFTSIPEKRHQQLPSSNHYSVSIFIIDSAARSQFYRHMPLTLKFMEDNDFQILQGYTKIGDNSAINLLGLLAGMVYEPEERGFNGLYYPEMVLNGSSLKKIADDFWPQMQSLVQLARDNNYSTLWNDEIATTGFGLFHYKAFNGFKSPPADYYYRPYYEYLYQRLGAHSGCVNGQFVAPRYIDIWERFVSTHLNTPHFAFNFLTGLTHASANNMELYDNPLSEALLRLKSLGAFDNTIVLIMGDHGQRISPIQKSHSGRVEERMPMMGVFLPGSFRRQFPQKDSNLRENKNRLVSNFDIHKTLLEVLQISGVKSAEHLTEERLNKSTAISLFDHIPVDRNCVQAKIPPQFCVCMELHQNAQVGVEIESLLFDELERHFYEVGSELGCVEFVFNLQLNSTRIYSLNRMVKQGIRYPKQWKSFLADQPSYNTDSFADDVLDVEILGNLDVKVNTNQLLPLSFQSRFSWYRNLTGVSSHLKMKVYPLLLNPPCHEALTLQELCKCFQ